MIQEVGNAVVLAVTEALRQSAIFLPNLVAAIVIFIVGVIVAVILRNALVRALEALGVERALSGTAVAVAVKKADSSLTVSRLIGEVLKWFVILVFLVPAIETLGLKQVSVIINGMVLYLPNVVYAAVIVTVGAVFAKFAQQLVLAAARGIGASLAEVAAVVARWAILIFAGLAALSQLGIAQDLIRTLFQGLVAMIALAGGLAFGLGGQGVAKEWMEKFKKELEG